MGKNATVRQLKIQMNELERMRKRGNHNQAMEETADEMINEFGAKIHKMKKVERTLEQKLATSMKVTQNEKKLEKQANFINDLKEDLDERNVMIRKLKMEMMQDEDLHSEIADKANKVDNKKRMNVKNANGNGTNLTVIVNCKL